MHTCILSLLQSVDAPLDIALTNGHRASPPILAEGLEWVGPEELHLLKTLAWDQSAYEWQPAPEELLLPDKIKASKDKVSPVLYSSFPLKQ